jgi:hypothetical protein
VTARRLILLVGAILLIVGVIFLFVPPSASGEQGSVGCGMPIAGGDMSAARNLDNQTAGNQAGNIPVVGPIIKDVAPQTQSHAYEDKCNSAVNTRLAWTIPLAVVGALVIAGSLAVGGRSRAA